VTFQVGANDGQVITVAMISLGQTVAAGSANWYDLSSASSLSQIDAAIDGVSATRATFGAIQNRLEYSARAAAAYQENLVSAESRIRDVDMALEMITFSKNQILQQAGTSMLSQANQASQNVLSLLR
jgi:flagellin